MILMTMRNLQRIFLALLLIGYLLIPAVHPGAAFSLTSYDLAEWLSLAPAERFAAPPLLTPFLLRLHIPLIAALWVLLTQRLPLHWALIPVILLAVGTLPPLEFLENPQDPNYRQLLFIAFMVLSCGFLRLIALDYAKLIAPISCGAGLLAILWAAGRTTSIFSDYRLAVSYWPPALIIALLYALILAAVAWEQKTRPR